MEYKVGDKVRMNRQSKYFKNIKNDISLAWWIALEHHEPITIVDIIEVDNFHEGFHILVTDFNDLQVSNLWVLPFEEDG